jgi:hypothetical protein
MFGLTAIVVVISTAAQQIPAYLLRDAQTGMAYIDPANALLSTGIGEIISFLVTTILSGMLIYAVAQGAIGKRATIGSSWRAVGGRLPRLIGLTLLIGLMLIAACLIPLVAIGFGGGMMVYSLDTASGAAGGLGLILLGLLGMAVAVGWIVVRTLLAPAALVLEGQGVMASLKRGWRLAVGGFGGCWASTC